MRIILPKRWMSTAKIDAEQVHCPLFFLAGPIRGGGDWQHRMCLLLQKNKRVHDCVIACPCRWSDDHTLAPHFIKGPENMFERQLDWERHWLQLAGRDSSRGCIIFWLACESETDPHPGPEPYAMDTRGELGAWRIEMKHDPRVRVVVGAEKNFHGLSQIQRNFNMDLGREFPIYPTMEETAEAGGKMLLGL